MEKIAAVVVTYNRLNLVKKTINSLRRQSHRLDKIIVVDNNATDGTGEWLDSQEDLYVIHQDNVGGSGGFYRGIQEAYQMGFDWIWCMDDDVFPRKDCLEFLLRDNSPLNGIICPRRVINNIPFQGEYTKLNLSNWFKSFHEEITPTEFYQLGKPFEIMGMAFEGPLINRKVVKKIGLPNKDLFIFFDDTEYSVRAIQNGFTVILEPNAILDKENFFINKTRMEMRQANSWKLYYEIRNNSYIHSIYGKDIFIKVIKPLGLLLKYDIAYLLNIFNKKYKFSDFISWHKAYIDGQKKVLGKKW